MNLATITRESRTVVFSNLVGQGWYFLGSGRRRGQLYDAFARGGDSLTVRHDGLVVSGAKLRVTREVDFEL